VTHFITLINNFVKKNTAMWMFPSTAYK
jgi:hypothetical protein